MNTAKMKKWIVIFAVIFLVCIGAFALLRHFGMQGTVAVIRVDGEVYEKINLDTVTVAYDMEIKTEFGYNKIHIEPGSISVTDADCRDRICIRQGAIDDAGVPIVCLPHRLTIEIEGGEIDA